MAVNTEEVETARSDTLNLEKFNEYQSQSKNNETTWFDALNLKRFSEIPKPVEKL